MEIAEFPHIQQASNLSLPKYTFNDDCPENKPKAAQDVDVLLRHEDGEGGRNPSMIKLIKPQSRELSL